MLGYFIEYRRLNNDLSVPNENAPWIPATLPSQAPVLNDILGVWDTRRDSDGLYEARLTINIRSGQPVYYRVAPLRVENNPPPFAITPTPQVVLPTIAPQLTQQFALPTFTPTPFDTSPQVEATTNANVRRGDSLAYEVISALRPGEIAPIIAISSTGSGWYVIQLPSGARGWIAPSVVIVRGDTRNLPRFDPPPPPSPTPIPFTPTPIAQANLVVTSLSLSVDPPRCKETFNITLRVTNNGFGTSNASGLIAVQDTHVATGTVAGTTSGGFPILSAGQSFDVLIPLTISTFYNEQHRITLVLDALNQVVETNEFDNTVTREYTLQKATCS
jgi:hypothetical protein